MTAAQAQVLQKPASVTIEQLGRYLDVHQAAAGAGCDSAAWAHMGSLERRWWRAFGNIRDSSDETATLPITHHIQSRPIPSAVAMNQENAWGSCSEGDAGEVIEEVTPTLPGG